MEIAVISETETENEMEETHIYTVTSERNPSKGVSFTEATEHFPARTGGMNKVLALDLGTITGWAACIDGRVQSGTWTFRPSRYEGGGMRYVRFRHQVAEAHALLGPFDAIYFEEVRRHAGTDAAHVYGGLLATLTAWCEESHVPYQGVPVATIKRHGTGKGNADKTAMIAAAVNRGWNPTDDNEADALWILDWARNQYGQDNPIVSGR
ncbi:MAG: hypothetical protein BWY59_00027 [Verrucomicrobia bacterium ADurb.Bin345]|nr:MAG: hypothetical protein BWY59_00027 [Verrucomicrobia bacterium ADurb.Bin345]